MLGVKLSKIEEAEIGRLGQGGDVWQGVEIGTECNLSVGSHRLEASQGPLEKGDQKERQGRLKNQDFCWH